MIDKTGEYWHFYFDEYCNDDPDKILALVGRLFAEIAEMGDVWYVRVKPEIERHELFDDGAQISVRCRFSAKPTISMQGTRITHIGLAPMDANKFCDKCGSDLSRERSYR